MKFNIYLFLLICILTSASAQENRFSLKGKLTGSTVPMKVFLYFRDGDRKVADSTMARDGKFTFSGNLEHASDATLYVHWIYPPNVKPEGSASEGKSFLLEKGTVTIEGKRLFDAKVTGGEGQRDYAAYHMMMGNVGDSVYRVWKAQQGQLPEDSTAAFQRLLYARQKIGKDETLKFIQFHPKSAMSFNILQNSSVIVEDFKYVEGMIDALKPEFGQTARFRAVEDKVALTKRLSIGQPATNFSQTDDKGRVVSLSDQKGKFVLVDFWASWCGPCRTEYPHLKAAYAKYKDKHFEIIGISIDDKKELWLDAIRSNGFEWIQLSDLKGRDNAIAKAYGIAAIPQNFLIDPAGKIIAKNLRGKALEEKLAEVIR